MYRLNLWILAILLILPFDLKAQTRVSFQNLWTQITAVSPDLRQAENELKAAQVGHKNQSLHWLPRVSISARALQTNEPAASFFSRLNQREIGAQDFQPSTLNEPGFGSFATSSLLIDLPLYEGGGPTAATESTQKVQNAREHAFKSIRQNQYAQAVAEYGLLLSSIHHQNRLGQLMGRVNNLKSTYALADPANPVGTSGLLGLRSIQNQIQGALKQSQTQIEILLKTLALKSQIQDAHWMPVDQEIRSFLKTQLGALPAPNANTLAPEHVQAGEAMSQALEKMSRAEKAKKLPRVGVFGQTDMIAGSRDVASSVTVGGYLQWNLFNPTEWKSFQQKQIEALAQKEKAKADLLKARTQSEESYLKIQMAEENLKLSKESLHLSQEQFSTSHNLYSQGMVNALQLTEVLGHQLEILVQIQKSEETLILENAHNYMMRGGNRDIP